MGVPTLRGARHSRRGHPAHRGGNRLQLSPRESRRHADRRKSRGGDSFPVCDGVLSGRQTRGPGKRADRDSRRASGHRFDRFRRDEGIRKGQGQAGAARCRVPGRPHLRPRLARPGRAGAQTPVSDPRPLRCGDHHDGHAARTQPGRDQFQHERGRGCEDQENQHRGQPGIFREGIARPGFRRTTNTPGKSFRPISSRCVPFT